MRQFSKLCLCVIIANLIALSFVMACEKKTEQVVDYTPDAVDDTLTIVDTIDEIETETEENEVDNIILGYEEYVDEFVALARKLLGGDFSVAEEFETTGANFEHWANRISEIEVATPEQIKKIEEITDKFTNAMR